MASRLVGAATGQGAEGRRPPAPFRSSPRCPVAVAVGPVPGLQPASPGSILPLPSKSVWPLCLAPTLQCAVRTARPALRASPGAPPSPRPSCPFSGAPRSAGPLPGFQNTVFWFHED